MGKSMTTAACLDLVIPQAIAITHRFAVRRVAGMIRARFWTEALISFSSSRPRHRSSCTLQHALIRPEPRRVVQPEAHAQ